MRIVLDAMGGDNAPAVEITGAVYAVKANKEIKVILAGKKQELKAELLNHKLKPDEAARIEVVNAGDIISMSESPAQAYKQKPDSSIAVSARLVKEGKADALVSAGNTGAVVVAALLGIGRIKGVSRPAILTPMPSASGITAVLDAGANVDCKPLHLAQFAVMGDLYSKHIAGVENPRVGLISVGEEEKKGNELTHTTRELIKSLNFNFIGNVEGRDVANGNVDVIVCDGFVGNVVLKTAEGTAKYFVSLIKQSIKKSLPAMLGALLMKGVFGIIKKKTDPNEYGGAPLIGIKKPVIIAHGSSNALGIRNSILIAAKFINRHINEEIQAAINNMEGKGE